MPLPSELPEEVDDSEDLARFLTSPNHFNATGPKPAAFMPNPKNGETSVFRHGGEPLEELQEIAQQNVSGRTIRGAAVVKASHVRKAKLQVQAKEPPPKHADIIGWPQANGELDKARSKEAALEICLHAKKIELL